MPILTRIEVSPALAHVYKTGGTKTFAAVGYDENDQVMAITPTWTSGTPAVGTINAVTGVFTAVACGKTVITATSGAVSGTAVARVHSSFASKLVCETIKDYLVDTAGLRAFNCYGKQAADVEKMLTENSGVIVLYEGADYEPETGQTIRGRINLTLFCVDLTIGGADDKEEFVSDILRQYVAGGPQAWQHFGLDTVYPALNFRPFMLTSERVQRFEENGLTWTAFTGYIQYYQSDLA